MTRRSDHPGPGVTPGPDDSIAGYELCSTACARQVWREVREQAARPVRKAMRSMRRESLLRRPDGTVRLYFRLPDWMPVAPGLEPAAPRQAGMTCACCGAPLPAETIN